MNITPETQKLIEAVQGLKQEFSDPASDLFIDFYCQCRQGMDYLFPTQMHQSVRLLDILQWFFECIDQKEPTSLVKLMWEDIVGPSLRDVLGDEKVEAKLRKSFEGDFRPSLEHWDRVHLPNGSVKLVMKELLKSIQQLETATNLPR